MCCCFFIQTGNEVVEISDLCPLLTESGEVMDPDIDKYMDFHFNSLLENVHLWRTRSIREDTNLLGNTQQMIKYLDGRKPTRETTARFSFFKAAVMCRKSVNWQHLCDVLKRHYLKCLDKYTHVHAYICKYTHTSVHMHT